MAGLLVPSMELTLRAARKSRACEKSIPSIFSLPVPGGTSHFSKRKVTKSVFRVDQPCGCLWHFLKSSSTGPRPLLITMGTSMYTVLSAPSMALRSGYGRFSKNWSNALKKQLHRTATAQNSYSTKVGANALLERVGTSKYWRGLVVRGESGSDRCY